MAAATDRFVAWCKQEQASIEQELDLIASGKVRIGEDKDRAGSIRLTKRLNALRNAFPNSRNS